MTDVEPLSDAELADLRELKVGDPYPFWAKHAAAGRMGIGDYLAPRFMATIDILIEQRGKDTFLKSARKNSMGVDCGK